MNDKIFNREIEIERPMDGTMPIPLAQPSTRSTSAVCVDVVDLRQVQTKYGVKHQIKLVFETAEMKANGYRRSASRTYNISYYEKANLRKDLERWRGKPLSCTELSKGVRFASLVGKSCVLEVVDAVSVSGHPYLRIEAIKPAVGSGLTPSGGYRRWNEPSGRSKQRNDSSCGNSLTRNSSPEYSSGRNGGAQDAAVELEAQAEAYLASVSSTEGGSNV